jgi:hypothetical protein
LGILPPYFIFGEDYLESSCGLVIYSVEIIQEYFCRVNGVFPFLMSFSDLLFLHDKHIIFNNFISIYNKEIMDFVVDLNIKNDSFPFLNTRINRNNLVFLLKSKERFNIINDLLKLK